MRKVHIVRFRVDPMWSAPAPDCSSVHAIRQLRPCEVCGALAAKDALIVVATPVCGRGGRYIHGYCYAVHRGIAAFKALNHGALSKVTLSEIIAMGLKDEWMAIVERSEKYPRVWDKDKGEHLSGCSELVNNPGSVLGKPCRRPATTLNRRDKPVCAWHKAGAIFHEYR